MVLGQQSMTHGKLLSWRFSSGHMLGMGRGVEGWGVGGAWSRLQPDASNLQMALPHVPEGPAHAQVQRTTATSPAPAHRQRHTYGIWSEEEPLCMASTKSEMLTLLKRKYSCFKGLSWRVRWNFDLSCTQFICGCLHQDLDVFLWNVQWRSHTFYGIFFFLMVFQSKYGLGRVAT